MLVPLDEDVARARVLELKEAGVEAVAVCFLFSFLNPEHEARVAAIVREEFPEAFLSVSSEVLPQYREYERFSTVCLNAFVGPTVASYVRRLEDELRGMGVRTGVHLMTSASGVATAEGAVVRPVNLLMSGPVAGVVGGIWAGRQAGYDNVITLDVGGTSADIGLAQEGRLRMKHLLDTRVGPLPGDDPDGRRRHDRSGRRLDRLRRPGRHLPRRPALGGRRPRTGSLRPQRHGGDRDRRDGQPRLAGRRRHSSAAA